MAWSSDLNGAALGAGLENAAGAVGRTLQTGAYGISQGPKQVQVILDRNGLLLNTHLSQPGDHVPLAPQNLVSNR